MVVVALAFLTDRRTPRPRSDGQGCALPALEALHPRDHSVRELLQRNRAASIGVQVAHEVAQDAVFLGREEEPQRLDNFVVLELLLLIVLVSVRPVRAAAVEGVHEALERAPQRQVRVARHSAPQSLHEGRLHS